MKRLALLLVLARLSASAEWRATQITVITNFDVPECVLFDAPASRVFVSNISAREGEYWTDDRRGFISLLGADGLVRNLRWLDRATEAPIHAPKGMCIANGILYFTDNARLMRCNIANESKSWKLERIALPAAENLNDLATDGKTVLVSDTRLNKIYRIDCSSGAIRGIPAPKSPNGVTFHQGKMFAVSWDLHEAFELDPHGKSAPKEFGLASHFKNLDGIEVLDDGTFLVSDFFGHKLCVIAPDRKTVRTLAELDSPADIGLDRKRGILYVPQFLKNQVAVFRLEKR